MEHAHVLKEATVVEVANAHAPRAAAGVVPGRPQVGEEA